MTYALHSCTVVIIWCLVLGYGVVEAGKQGHFSNHDVQGNYGFVFDGVLIDRNDGTTVPIAAVGQFLADGKGQVLSLIRTLNIGGEVEKAQARGLYTVNPDGTGTAEFSVRTLAVDGSVRSQGIERFSFVLDTSGKTIHFIGLEMKGANDEDRGIGIVLRGEAQRQRGHR